MNKDPILLQFRAEICLNQSMELMQFLNYEVEIIRKAGRRNLTLCMRPEKYLTIKTNHRTSQTQIADFLNQKQKWIEKNILKFKMTESQFESPTFTQGSKYPFLGEQKYFQFAESSRSRPFFKVEDGFLVCYLPKARQLADFSELQLTQALRKYYKTEAETYLKNRLSFWVELTSLTPKNLVIRSNKSRWGSCSSQHSISLNWKLICQSKPLIDYVIVHELCHLKYFNHSKDFWNLVESILPDHRQIKNILNQQQRLGQFLG